MQNQDRTKSKNRTKPNQNCFIAYVAGLIQSTIYLDVLFFGFKCKQINHSQMYIDKYVCVWIMNIDGEIVV